MTKTQCWSIMTHHLIFCTLLNDIKLSLTIKTIIHSLCVTLFVYITL